MKIVKKIGNNAAIGIDENNKEIVVLGKGIGFPKVPYQLTDSNKIEKIFYNVDSKYLELINDLSNESLIASSDILEQAEINLGCKFNPNFIFTLADHIDFAVYRVKTNLNLYMPLSYEIKFLYKDEYELGLLGLDIIEDYFKIRLPEEEAGNIAFHILNSKINKGQYKNDNTMEYLRIIENINDIVEKCLLFKINHETFRYSRYVMHLRFLFERLDIGENIEEVSSSILNKMVEENSEVYSCVNQITDYLKNDKNWKCSDDEKLYLMIHIRLLYNNANNSSKNSFSSN